jgi:hypothetical protein
MRGNPIPVRGVTDANGLFFAEGITTRNTMGGTVFKDGYYTTAFKFPFGQNEADWIKDGRWQPWNPTIPVILREERNPIPMYVKRFEEVFGNGDTIGFDCEKGDFVEPHGKGKIADFMIWVEGRDVQDKQTKEIRLDALDPESGFMIMKKHDYSAFK